jgi:transcriptional regulator with XRE-family HTH domain
MFDQKRMQKAREDRGLSQSQLAKLIHGKQTQVAAYESGGRIPRADTLGRIAQSLQVSADYLLGLVPEPNGYVSVLSSQERALLDTIEKGVSFNAIQALASFLEGRDK